MPTSEVYSLETGIEEIVATRGELIEIHPASGGPVQDESHSTLVHAQYFPYLRSHCQFPKWQGQTFFHPSMIGEDGPEIIGTMTQRQAVPSEVTDELGNPLTASLSVPNGATSSAVGATLFLTCPNHLVEFWEHARGAMKAGHPVKLHLPSGSTIAGCTVVDVVALSGQDAYRVEILTSAK